MPTRKQKRRRQKDRRHEYEYVYVDDEGQEVEVDDDEADATPAKSAPAKAGVRPNAKSPKPAGKAAARRQPAGREVKPPSWDRVLRARPDLRPDHAGRRLPAEAGQRDAREHHRPGRRAAPLLPAVQLRDGQRDVPAVPQADRRPAPAARQQAEGARRRRSGSGPRRATERAAARSRAPPFRAETACRSLGSKWRSVPARASTDSPPASTSTAPSTTRSHACSLTSWSPSSCPASSPSSTARPGFSEWRTTGERLPPGVSIAFRSQLCTGTTLRTPARPAAALLLSSVEPTLTGSTLPRR